MTLAVVGTDTGVGKTVVTAGLVAHLRHSGQNARAIKPAQTAFPTDDDAGYVQRICGDDSAATRLRTFGEPLAPAVAARRSGDELAFDSLLEDIQHELETVAVGVVEGAGGVRVPLSTDPPREIIDLVAALEFPTLIVSRPGLGTLNHTTLTVEALRARDVPVVGVVLNRYPPQPRSVAERTNPAELERLCACPVRPLPEVSPDDPKSVRELGTRVAELCADAGALSAGR